MPIEEIPLSSGRTTSGVVRIGNTVRRPPTANSGFVHRLLRHLEANRFDGAPSFVGTDERGRGIFSFIEGEVPPDLAFQDDDTLESAARLIRRYHDATEGLIQGAEVVCHNDLSPCNFVFRNGRPIAIIDFDAAAPGTRAHDLSYAAWLWLDIGSPEFSPPEQRRRLALFLAAYGDETAAAILPAMLERQQMLIDEGKRGGKQAMSDWAAQCRFWTRTNLSAV